MSQLQLEEEDRRVFRENSAKSPPRNQSKQRRKGPSARKQKKNAREASQRKALLAIRKRFHEFEKRVSLNRAQSNPDSPQIDSVQELGSSGDQLLIGSGPPNDVGATPESSPDSQEENRNIPSGQGTIQGQGNILELTINNEAELGKSVSNSSPTGGSRFRNIWFWRAMGMVLVQVISGLLLLYNFIFSSTYQYFGNTTSYYPWAWSKFITDSSTVSNLFSMGFLVSVALLFASTALIFGYFVPALRKTMNIGNESSRGLSLRLRGQM